MGTVCRGLTNCSAAKGVLLAAALTLAGIGHAQEASNEDVLKELRSLRDRVGELEKTVESQQQEIGRLKGQGEPSSEPVPAKEGKQVDTPETLETRLSAFKDELIETLAGEESPLKISGFFDVTLESPNERDRPFEFGALELDLEYPFNEHYTVSSALVWDGDTAEVGVGIVDYHWFDDAVPARGRIFDEPGFHLQAGRFDLPFGVDYQFFATSDRPNISAPLTTERIQLGGYNSDGARLYGTWKTFDYALYAVDSLYGDNGGTVGGRIGFFPWRDPYRLHRFGGNRSLEFGLSYLQDMDNHGDGRDRVYGADMTLNYKMFHLVAEWMKRDSDPHVLHRAPSLVQPDVEIVRDLGQRSETGLQVSLVTDLETIVNRPVSLFCRFDAWDPDYDFLVDAEDDTLAYRVKNTQRVTFGVGYNVTDSIRLKLEYYDYLGDGTREPGFDDSRAMVQLVARF